MILLCPAFLHALWLATSKASSRHMEDDVLYALTPAAQLHFAQSLQALDAFKHVKCALNSIPTPLSLQHDLTDLESRISWLDALAFLPQDSTKS
jgi:hypothetical protein